MARSNAEVKQVIQAIKILGARGAHFQFPTLREKLDISTDDKSRAASAHNLLKELLDSRVLEIVSGDRQRNRYYRVKSEWKLRAFAEPSSLFFHNGKGQRRTSRKIVKIAKVQTTRVAKNQNINPIEDSIQKIDARLENIESVLSELRAIWK